MKEFIIRYKQNGYNDKWESVTALDKLEAAQKFYIEKCFSRPEIEITIGEIKDIESIIIRNTPQISIEKRN